MVPCRYEVAPYNLKGVRKGGAFLGTGWSMVRMEIQRQGESRKGMPLKHSSPIRVRSPYCCDCSHFAV